jgi:hypothetical protein
MTILDRLWLWLWRPRCAICGQRATCRERRYRGWVCDHHAPLDPMGRP